MIRSTNIDYDAITAKVLGWKYYIDCDVLGANKWRVWYDPSTPIRFGMRHPAQDFNALHSAIAVLEAQGWYFDREDYEWHVYHGSRREVIKCCYRFGPEHIPEALAIAKCIAAAEKSEEERNGS